MANNLSNRDHSDQDYLVEVVQELSTARTLGRVAEIVRRAARRLANADGASFILRDDDQCHYFDEDAIAPLWKGLKFPMEACVSGISMLQGISIAIPDIYKDSRVPIAAYKPTFVKSMLMTPIRQTDAIGAIGVYWSYLHPASPQETQLLSALAHSTSVAMQNITLHNALERKIAELEQAAALKDQFLLMLSHELRTPMNSILGWSEILKEESADLNPDDIRNGIDSIHRNAKTEMRLIADLLDSSQILGGRMSISKKLVNMNEILNVAVQSVQVQMNKKRLKLRLRDLAVQGMMMGDTDRLQQMIGNLLSNAIKFTPEGGEISIDLINDANQIVLAVQDNGEGIDSDTLPHIFERFQVQNHSLTRRHGGLGLGLAIVKSLTAAHGGSIKAFSKGENQGARFELRLPLANDNLATGTVDIWATGTVDTSAALPLSAQAQGK